MSKENKDNNKDVDIPSSKAVAKYSRAAMQSIAGAVPLFGGLLSAAAGAWSEKEQEKINQFLHAYMQMLRDEMEEKHQTMAEILARVDMQDEKIAQRVETKEYQSLVRKAFRDWAGAESYRKREYVRNVLSNAASTTLTSDDVVRLFLDWLYRFSEFHLSVIAEIYKNPNSTRLEIWTALGKEQVREDSADADLFKLLIRDLSTGGIIRQYRETDYQGNFIKAPTRRSPRGVASNRVASAFEDDKPYILTELGEQFVHYAMTDIPIKLEFFSEDESNEAA